jgi:hypothetical protein
MPDFNTCLKLLANQTHRTSTADVEMASIAIINAMDFYKSYQFHFNNGYQQFFIKAGTDRITSTPIPHGTPPTRHALPHGIIRPIVLQVVGIVTDGDVDTGAGTFNYTPLYQDPLRQVSVEELFAYQGGAGQFRTTGTGYPMYFAWMGSPNSDQESIRIAPVPAVDLIVDCFFVQDAHRPRYRHVSDAWSFEELRISSGDFQFWEWVSLTSTYENYWLRDAEPLIRQRAMYDLQLNFYHDVEAAKVCQIAMREEEDRLGHEKNSAVIGTLRRYPSVL